MAHKCPDDRPLNSSKPTQIGISYITAEERHDIAPELIQRCKSCCCLLPSVESTRSFEAMVLSIMQIQSTSAGWAWLLNVIGEYFGGTVILAMVSLEAAFF